MCLMAFALNAHPDRPLVLWANRDEFHERPAAPSDWWDAPTAGRVWGGRDLQAGGTWMALNTQFQLAALTNIRQVPAKPSVRSRGELVLSALSGTAFGQLPLSDFAAFNLLRFEPDQDSLSGLCWRAQYVSADGQAMAVPDGLHSLSNARLNTPWPKSRQLHAALAAALSLGRNDAGPHAESDCVRTVTEETQGHPTIGVDELTTAGFAALGDRRVHPDADLPQTGVPLEWERMLSACHIVSPAYGTRCSTVVQVDRAGRVHWHERTFNPVGDCISEVARSFPSDGRLESDESPPDVT